MKTAIIEKNDKWVSEMTEKRVGFLQAFKLFFTHYVDFEGKSTRAAYWWWQLWEFLIGLILGGLFALAIVVPLANRDGDVLMSLFTGIIVAMILLMLWGLGTLVPRIALLVRRYRDAGVNPLLVLLTLGAPYLISQYLSIRMVLDMSTVSVTGRELPTLIGQHPALFITGYGLIVLIEIGNFIVTLLPSSSKRRFL